MLILYRDNKIASAVSFHHDHARRLGCPALCNPKSYVTRRALLFPTPPTDEAIQEKYSAPITPISISTQEGEMDPKFKTRRTILKYYAIPYQKQTKNPDCRIFNLFNSIQIFFLVVHISSSSASQSSIILSKSSIPDPVSRLIPGLKFG